MHTNSFINYLKFEKRFSEHTVLSYSKDMEQFKNFIDKTYQREDLEKLSSFEIRSWMIDLLNSGIKPNSIKRKLSVLSTYLK